MSDWYIANSSGGAVGKRIQVVILYLVGVAISLLAFRAVPSGALNKLVYDLRLTWYRTGKFTSSNRFHDWLFPLWAADADR